MESSDDRYTADEFIGMAHREVGFNLLREEGDTIDTQAAQASALISIAISLEAIARHLDPAIRTTD